MTRSEAAPLGSVSRNTAWALLGTVGTGPAVLLATWIVARGLPMDAHGRLQAALASVALVTSVGGGGFVAATVQRTAQGRPVERAVATGLVGVTAVGGTAALLVVGGGGPEALAVAGVSLLAAWGAVIGAGARGVGRFDGWAAAEWSNKLVRLLGFAAVYALGGLTVGAALAVVGAAEAVAAAVAARAARISPRAMRTTAAEVVDAARFGGAAWSTTVVSQVHDRVDVLLLAAWRDPAEVAAYAIAAGVAQRLRGALAAPAAALHPTLARDPAAGRAAAVRGVASVGAASAVVGGAAAAVAPWLLPWVFGAPYAASVVPTWLLLLAAAAWGVFSVLARWFQAAEQQRVNTAAVAAGAAVNLVLNVWWIPRWGAGGAAAASAVSHAVQAAWVGVAFVRAR